MIYTSQTFIQNFIYEAALSRTRHSRNAHKFAERNFYIPLRLFSRAPFIVSFLPFPFRRSSGTAIFLSPERYCPVREPLFFIMSSAVPCATSFPPYEPTPTVDPHLHLATPTPGHNHPNHDAGHPRRWPQSIEDRKSVV